MNILVGFETVIRHPIILLYPIVLQVLLSFLIGFGILFGVDLQSASFTIGDSGVNEVNFQATIPMFIPLIEDLKLSLSFLPTMNSENMLLVIGVIIFYQIILSFMIGLYLGVLKQKIIPGSHENRSPFQLGTYFFRRIFLFQLFYLFLVLCVGLLVIAIFPIGLLLIIFLIMFSLIPYIIVLEDVEFGEALSRSPKYLRKFFFKFLPLALGALLTTTVFSLSLHTLGEDLLYYIALIGYTFIGSAFIAGFMFLLHRCIEDEPTKEHVDFQPDNHLWKKLLVGILIFVLPIIGLQFAKGVHVTAFPIKPTDTYKEAVSFQSDWSPAFYGSDHQLTTYGFIQDDNFELSLSLPDSLTEDNSIYGRGELTWIVHKDRVTRTGNHTTHWGEDVVEQSEFIYRLYPNNDGKDRYFTTINNGFAHIMDSDQFDVPIGMEIFVMNDGEDVFVMQYNKQFDPYSLIRIDHNANYFVPATPPQNPNEHKYFWYSKKPMTIERVLDFLHAKNEHIHIYVDPVFYDVPYIAATFLQEADGEALINIGEQFKENNISTNILDKSASEWSEITKQLYADTNFETFLTYISQANMYSGYDEIGREDDEGDGRETDIQLIVPFPKGEITIHQVWKEGQLIELMIELPEE